MYSVYINHFNRNNAIVNTEELMFAVPIITSALINKPVVKSNEDAADSFSFSMELNSPYYDAILPYKTTIRVEYDGDVIFWGRALSPSTSTVLHTKTVQCEGTYTYFNDTYYEGVQEKHRKNITVDEYLTKAITNHNDMVPGKQIFKGNVQVTLPAKQDKYEPTSWTQTTSILSDLTSNNGGHMRIRYTNGNAYLDWYKYYIRDLGDGVRPSVTVGKNILDISSAMNNGEIFTRIIPVGTTSREGKPIYIDGYKYKDKDNVEHTYYGKAMPVSFVRNLYTSTQLTDEFHDWTDYRDAEDNYGIIYKVVSFSDADKQEKLFEEVKKWIKECYFSISSSFTVKAVDMHIVDHNVPKILLGDCVDVTFLMTVNGTKQWVTKKLVCKAVQYDLYNPENNSYTFGVPSDLLNAASRNRSKSSKKSASDNVGSSHKVRTPNPKEEDEDVTWLKVLNTIISSDDTTEFEGHYAGVSFESNQEIGGAVSCFDPDDFDDHDPAAHYDLWFDAKNIGKITLAGAPTRYVAVSADRGIFAYEVRDPELGPQVVHWYTKHKGYKYEGKSTQLINEEKTGETYATDNGTPEGNKTFELRPKELSFPEYSNEKTYSYGSMATHDGHIYKCKINMSSPEEWNSSHWEQQGTASEGKLLVGFDVTAGSGDKWKIKLNTPVQYTDKDNNVKVADGFVTASDFSVQEIPSFKTKIGIFDIVIAGKVEAEQISADLAEVRKWLGEVISANTRITSAQGIFTNLVCTDITSGTYTHNHYDSGSMVSRKLEKCFYSFAFSESDGEITLTQYSLDGARSESHSFNMASTQFFIDEVEAAYERGKEEGGASADSIRGKNGDTHTSKPSGYDFGTLQDAIAEANESANGKWVTFQMYIDGNESDTKTYRVFVNGYG